MEEINIKEFLKYLKKYTLTIILITLIAVSGIFLYDKFLKTPMYSTYTTLVLVKDESNVVYGKETIEQSDITLNQKLVATYRIIMKSDLVLNQVIKNLGLDYTTTKLYKEVNVQSTDETEILKVTVTDSSAERAAKIANSLAEVFDKEVKKIYNISNVSVIDEAKVNKLPSNNTVKRDIFLAAFLAIFGASAVIFVVFYFDDTLRYKENLEEDIEMPVIAKVFRDDNKIDLVVDKKPKAATSENIRTLRTNLQFAAIDTDVQTLLVTSTMPSEGKSFISANLAISFAQAGKKVLLIDCDLRKGRQHKIFKVSSKKGLSNLLIGDIKEFPKYISETKIENLSLLPRGVFPPNPSELLNSKKNAKLIELLKKYFDVIIMDGAPCNGLSDSLILSTLVDKVLLVSSVNYTPKTELKNTKKALEAVGANIAGCVVNNIDAKRDLYGRYYYYHYGYGHGYGYGYGEDSKK